jgi:chromosomal replication initiation ATPase DnaA
MAAGVELTDFGLGERDMSTPTPPDHSGPAQLAEQWARIRGRLQQEVGDVEYRTWLRQMTLAGIDGDEIALHLPTRFLRDWVREHYADRLSTLWRSENPAVRQVEIRVGGGAPAMNGLAESLGPNGEHPANHSPTTPGAPPRGLLRADERGEPKVDPRVELTSGLVSPSTPLSSGSPTNSLTRAPDGSRNSPPAQASTRCSSMAASVSARPI